MKQAIFAVVAALLTGSAYANENSALRAEIEPLQFLVGWCWAGLFPDGKQIDVHCFEPVYGGVHLRDRHAVSGGSALYQGETIYSWSKDTSEITYVYWNSYGGISTGTATPGAGNLAFPDETYSGSNGETVTISSVWENITADGYDSLTVETYQNGEKKERRVRYAKRPFVKDPVKSK